MTELIPLNQSAIAGAHRQTVNARDLHAFLEVGKEFANWIKDRIDQYGFTQDVDFVIFAESGKNGGRPLKQYYLTLDMAKELSMVERNAKGKQARQYFIDCEQRLKSRTLSPAELIIAQGQALLAVEQQQARHAQQIAALEHRIDMMDGDTGYQTVTAYIRKHGWKIPLSQAKALGLKASKLAKDLRVQVGTVPDERWGTVNSYPIALLDEVVSEFFGSKNKAA